MMLLIYTGPVSDPILLALHSPNSSLRNLKPTLKFRTPVAKGQFHSSSPARDDHVLAQFRLGIHGLSEESDPGGELIRPCQTQTWRFEILVLMREGVVAPSGEETLLVV